MMKRKNIIWFVSLLGALICYSCIDDKGNYSYQEPESVLPIEISGLSDTTFKVLSTVILEPEVKGIKNEEDYRFTWYTYPYMSSGYIPKRDTLGTSRNLSFVMNYPAGETHVLVYEIRDKKTDLFVNQKIYIKGSSDFAKGWFVLNDENDQTDVDFVFPDGSVQEDILSQALGKKLQGIAVKIVYQDGGYTHEIHNSDGTVTTLNSKKALHILSSKDMVVLNPDNMSVYKTFEEEFYEAPEIAVPQDILTTGWTGDIYLMNAGKIHTIDGMSMNIGKFGLAKFDHADLFPKMLLFSGGNSSVLSFSHATKSFIATDVWSTKNYNLLEAEPDAPLVISPTNMNADIKALLFRVEDYDATKAYALMKSISGPEEYYLADIAFSGQQYPFVDFDTIPASRGIVDADVYGGHQVNSIYFAKGNVLSYYQKNASDEVSYEKNNIYPFPIGETITYIEQVESPYGSKEPFNNLMVLTNSTNGWKLYRFELEGDGTSPNIATDKTPVVYSGKGFARHIMYIE